MVRNYKRKRITEYSEENLKRAIEAVRKKEINSYLAADKYGIRLFTACMEHVGLSSQNQENQLFFR